MATTQRIEFSFRQDFLLGGDTAEERNAILAGILENERLEAQLRAEDEMLAQWREASQLEQAADELDTLRAAI